MASHIFEIAFLSLAPIFMAIVMGAAKELGVQSARSAWAGIEHFCQSVFSSIRIRFRLVFLVYAAVTSIAIIVAAPTLISDNATGNCDPTAPILQRISCEKWTSINASRKHYGNS